MNKVYQTYLIAGLDTRDLGTGFKGRIRTQQSAHRSNIAANINNPVFHPNKLNKYRDNGPNVIEPIPVPAVTIPNQEIFNHP